MSCEQYSIYEVEEGVMAMKDQADKKIYYFPACSDINPELIKSRPTHHLSDLEDFEDLIDLNN